MEHDILAWLGVAFAVAAAVASEAAAEEAAGGGGGGGTLSCQNDYKNARTCTKRKRKHDTKNMKIRR
jgi:hypothetical protein